MKFSISVLVPSQDCNIWPSSDTDRWLISETIWKIPCNGLFTRCLFQTEKTKMEKYMKNVPLTQYLLILISKFFIIINLCFPSYGRDFCILHKNMYIIVGNVMRNHSPTYLFWNWRCIRLKYCRNRGGYGFNVVKSYQTPE